MLRSVYRSIRDAVKARLETGLEDWFYYWICAQNQADRRNTTPRLTYYEFGVGWGRTLTAFARAALKAHRRGRIEIRDVRIYAFDSFAGLPDKASIADDHPDWKRGSFSFDEAYVVEKLRATGFPEANVRLIKGFFDHSLTPALAEELSATPPSIVTVDVDYYSSTAQVLTFLAPLLRSGAVLYFDDLYSFHLHPDMGQVKAINEFHGRHGYLSPLREYDVQGRAFMFAAKEWEHRGSPIS